MSKLILWHPDIPKECKVQFGATIDDWVEKRGYSNVICLSLYGPIRSYTMREPDVPITYCRLIRSQCVRIGGADQFWLIEPESPTDLEAMRAWSVEAQEARHDM